MFKSQSPCKAFPLHHIPFLCFSRVCTCKNEVPLNRLPRAQRNILVHPSQPPSSCPCPWPSPLVLLSVEVGGVNC
ncbi:hypothetical protein LEMLEM_LOCUS24115, partial [Lemmus lemmus]